MMQIVQINRERKHKGQFTQQQLLKLMGDIDGQPDWRTDANLAASYYDGDQILPEVAQKLEARGQPVECQNLIAPAIDAVLGTEAKTRSDLQVEANYQNDDNVEKPDDVAVRFSLTGKDGLFTKPRPGETETEATQRRSADFGKVVQQTMSNVHNLRPTDILKRLTSKISTNALMISTLTNRQLAAVYSKLMKTDYAGHYQDLQAQMEARRNRIMNSAERGIENQWNTLGKEEGSKLSDLMHDATMTRIHPDRALAEQLHFQELKYEAERLKSTAFAPGNESDLARYDVVKRELDAIRENYADLNNRWRALSPEAKKLWKDTEKWYKNSYTELKNALMQRIQDVGGDQHAALIRRVREQFEMALKDGPYFPLARFGKFVVTARKDGDYIREHFEDKASALAALEAYKKDGYDAVQTVKSQVNGTNQDSGYSVGKSILEMIQKADDENLTKDVLTDKVWQSMLELMPDSSYAKHFIRRRRVKGASHDARRAFANSAFHFAHHISKIEYGHLMGGVLDDMGNEIDAAMKGEYIGVQPENLETAQRMLDELKMRHEMTMNPSGDGFGNALTGAGYVFNMAANPSSALINMTQTALVALPQLAARYGWRNALKEMGRATVDYFRSADKRFTWFGKDSSWLDRDAWLSMSRGSKLAADEVELMKRLNADGVISITQASSLAQRAETGTQDKIHFNKALDMSILVGGQLFHNVEVANREVTALAAYRLAKAAGGGKIDPSEAYKIASNAVYDAHFDYSSSNRPRWMRKSWQKVIFQFKMYAQHMFYTLGRSFEQSFRGETPEVRRQARKEFMSYMLMHTLAAGVTGLPYAIQAIFGAAAQGIHSVVSDDEGPWDPEIALKNWLHDEIGGFAATAITDGVVNALGIDLHSRVGIQDLLWRSPPEGTEGKDLYVYYMEQMLGPTIGGIGLNFATGYDKMAKGDWLGGIQTVTPAAVRNLVKTYNEATRGVTTASGEEVLAPDEFTPFELAAQALGFSPSRIGQAYDSRTAIKNAQSEQSGERSQLMQRYFANAMNGSDNSGVLEDIEAYNRSNPSNAITGDMIIKAVRQKQKDRIKKARGLALSKKDEHLRELGRFGNYSPIL